jgi:hypothetical protein
LPFKAFVKFSSFHNQCRQNLNPPWKRHFCQSV